jgi:hypothetical protein
MTMRSFALALAAVVGLPAAAGALARTAAAAEAVELAEAAEQDEGLERLLSRTRATNDEIILALETVAAQFHEVKAPEDPEALKTFRDRVKSYRSRARAHFLAALLLVKVDPKLRENVRDPVAIAAARILGTVFSDSRTLLSVRQSVARDLVRALETSLYKPHGYHVSIPLTETCFDSLARLNQIASLEWMVDQFIHTRDVAEDVAQLIAAQKAMVKFTGVPGSLRLRIVKRMVAIYAGVETRANSIQGFGPSAEQAARLFWDQVRVVVIAVLAFYAREPVDAQGQGFTTVREFQVWFQANDNPRRQPWLDRPPRSA